MNTSAITIDTALEEYEAGDEDEKVKLIYAYFGLAVYEFQVLEQEPSNMLSTDRILKKKAKTKNEVDEIIDDVENSKKTLGVFVNEVKQSYSLSDTTVTDLRSILSKRNYIVHKYFKVEGQKFYSDLGRREMLTYLCFSVDETKALCEKLQNVYFKYASNLGLTVERLNQLASEMIEEELEREENYQKGKRT